MKLRWPRLLPAWLVIFTLAHFSHDLLTALLTPLLPFIRDDFGLDYTRAGLLLSIFSITYGLSQLPSGWLADRIGPGKLMSISIGGVALGAIIIGLTPSYTLLLVGLGLTGVLGSAYHPAAVPLVAATINTTKSGSAIGIHAMGGSASFFIAPFFAVACAALWGWRSSFLILAVPTLIFGLFLYARTANFKLDSDFGVKATDNLATRETIKKSELYPFMTLGSMIGVVGATVVAFIPLFVVDHLKYSQETAVLMLAVIYLTGMFASPLAGLMSDRLGRKPLLIGSGLAFLPVVYFLTEVSNAWYIYALLVAVGVIVAFSQNSSESFIIGNVDRNKCSTTLGTFYFINMAGMGLLSPTLGALIDSRDFSFGFILLGGIVALASLIYLLWVKMRRQVTA